ncbi:MAG: diguanylate cyclase, partial [Comamonas sp.]
MTQQPRRLRSLRTQIALVFGGFVAVVVFLLSLVAGELMKIRLQKQAGASLQIVAHNAATLLQQELMQQSRRTTVLAQSKELWQQGLGSRTVAETLQRVQYINPHSVWIGVTDTHGRVLNSTGNLLKGSDVSQRPWFQEALKGPYISEVHPAKLLADLLPRTSSGEPLRLVDFSAPIHHPDGSLLGVVGIHGSWDWARDAVEQLLQGSAQTQQQSIFIFDAQGELIYAPGGNLQPYTELKQSWPGGLSQQHPRPVVVHWKDRSSAYLTVAERLPAPSAEHDLGWWIVARQPIEAAYADANRVLWSAVGLGLLAVLMAASIAWRLAAHVSNDMKRLAHAVSNVSIDAGSEIPLLHSNREVRQLSQALSDMTRQLLHANQDMQAQVQQRTLELQAANAELQRQASTDPLTQLLNRRGFETQAHILMGLAQRSGRALSAVSLDIDFFKTINDRYGHDVGDAVLRQLGQMLSARTRQSDIVGRLGGEEFVILLPDTDQTSAQTMAQHLIEAVAQQRFAAVGTVTVSAGVSSLQTGNTLDSLTSLLKRSDEALYEAKRQGRN